MRPNVILVVLDAVRADALEPYGASPGATPAIADLARRGFALPSAYAAATWTLPSHVAMLTGQLPRATGLLQAPEQTPHSCRPAVEAQHDRMLPEVLRRNGYSTAGVSTNLWLTPESGFATGFDEFVTVDTHRQSDLAGEGVRARASWALEGVRARVDDGAAEAGETFSRWIDSPPGQPFFWFVNLVEAHSPYLPPRPYNDLGMLDRWRAAEEARQYLTMGTIWQACAGGLEVPTEALDRMRHLYGRAIRYLDDWLAGLLEHLDSAGILDETLVIVTSDHGENFGEDGLMAHAFSLDDRLLRVPFVIAGPGASNIREPFSLASVPRLIAEAAGIGSHPWANSLPPEGVAVAQFDPPAPIDDPRWTKVLREWGLRAADAEPRIASSLTCATNGRYKLQLRGSEEELYDLAEDPLELTPQPPDAAPQPVLARLRKGITHGTGQAPAAPAPSANGGPEPTGSEEELRELEDRMRLLGYL